MRRSVLFNIVNEKIDDCFDTDFDFGLDIPEKFKQLVDERRSRRVSIPVATPTPSGPKIIYDNHV